MNKKKHFYATYIPVFFATYTFNFGFLATPYTCHPVVSIVLQKVFLVVETLQLD